MIEKAVDEEMTKRRAMAMPGETVNVDGDDGEDDGAATKKKRSLEEEEEEEEEGEKKSKKKKKKTEGKEEDVEIAEANALRLKLGLKPLRG